ncbi:hypothetical protein Tco_1409078 [Tanacetum coccineum]
MPDALSHTALRLFKVAPVSIWVLGCPRSSSSRTLSNLTTQVWEYVKYSPLPSGRCQPREYQLCASRCAQGLRVCIRGLRMDVVMGYMCLILTALNPQGCSSSGMYTGKVVSRRNSTLENVVPAQYNVGQPPYTVRRKEPQMRIPQESCLK